MKLTSFLFAAALLIANTASAQNQSPLLMDSTITASAQLDSALSQVLQTEGSDQLLVMSQNGRYAVRGPVLDLWTGETITSIEGITRARNHVNLAKLPIKDSDIDPLYFGEGAQTAHLFVDPLCQFCKQILEEIYMDTSLTDDFTFKIYLVPLVGDESSRAVSALSCAKNRDRAIQALMESDVKWMVSTAAKITDCDVKPIMNRSILTQMIGVTGVPHLIGPNGGVNRGVPDDLRSFLEQS